VSPGSPWEILGIPGDASRETARKAWLALVRIHHPDAGGDVSRLAEINAAWAMISGGEYRVCQPFRRNAVHSGSVGVQQKEPVREIAKSAPEILASRDGAGARPEMILDGRGWRAEGLPPWSIRIRFAAPAMVESAVAEALPLPYAIKRAHHRAVELHEIVLRLTDGRELRFPFTLTVCADRDLALRFPDGAGPAESLEIVTHEALLPPGWKNLRIHGRLSGT